MKVFLYEDMLHVGSLKIITGEKQNVSYGRARLADYTICSSDKSMSGIYPRQFLEVIGEVYEINSDCVLRIRNYYGNKYKMDNVQVEMLVEDSLVPKKEYVKAFVLKEMPVPSYPLDLRFMFHRMQRYANTFMHTEEEKRNCDILIVSIGSTINPDNYRTIFPYNIRRFKECGYSYSKLLRGRVSFEKCHNEVFIMMSELLGNSVKCFRDICLEGMIREVISVVNYERARDLWLYLIGKKKVDIPPEIEQRMYNIEGYLELREVTKLICESQSDMYFKWLWLSKVVLCNGLPVLAVKDFDPDTCVDTYMNRMFEVFKC